MICILFGENFIFCFRGIGFFHILGGFFFLHVVLLHHYRGKCIMCSWCSLLFYIRSVIFVQWLNAFWWFQLSPVQILLYMTTIWIVIVGYVVAHGFSVRKITWVYTNGTLWNFTPRVHNTKGMVVLIARVVTWTIQEFRAKMGPKTNNFFLVSTQPTQ